MRASTNGVSLYLPGLSSVSHKLLDSLIKRAGFERAAFGEMDTLQHPAGTRVVLTFGEDALRIFTGEVGILRQRGHVFGSAPLVLPTFAPDFLVPRRGEDSSTKFTGVVISDIRKAVKVAREGYQPQRMNYILDPSPSVANQWVDRYADALQRKGDEITLSHDIETAFKAKAQDESEVDELDFNILRVGFAWQATEALTVPWLPEYMSVIKRLYELPGAKVGWNSAGFDVPVLHTNKVFPQGEQYDGMDAWHVFQPVLPRKLEFVSGFYCDIKPWKHTNKSEFALYNAKDTLATIAIWEGLKRDMSAVQVPDFSIEVAA
jgi:hypothetical protein